MANLFLYDGNRKFVDMNVVHDVAVAKAVDGQFVQTPASGILAILAVDAGFDCIVPEYLSEPVLAVRRFPVLPR